MPSEYLLEDCVFTSVNKDLLQRCSPFICVESDLNDFFQSDCIQYNNELLGKTYCFLDKDDSSVIVCAFTVANDSIKMNHIPSNRKNLLNRKISFIKRGKSYPAVLIGRLGINSNYKGLAIGSQLMDFIKAWFIDPQNKTGCRYIVVDAYNKEKPIEYYQKCGFKFLFEDSKTEMKYSYNQSPEQWKGGELSTRLMYFDLIEIKRDY